MGEARKSEKVYTSNQMIFIRFRQFFSSFFFPFIIYYYCSPDSRGEREYRLRWCPVTTFYNACARLHSTYTILLYRCNTDLVAQIMHEFYTEREIVFEVYVPMYTKLLPPIFCDLVKLFSNKSL